MNAPDLSHRPVPLHVPIAAVLPRLGRHQAEWANRIYRSGDIVHPGGARLRFCADGGFTPHAHLRLMAGPERLTLLVESLPGLAPCLGGPCDDWPQEEWSTLVEIAAAPLFDMLARALGTPLHLAQVHLGDIPAAGEGMTLAFHYRPQDDAPPVRARLLCGALAGLALVQPSPGWHAWRDLPVALRLGAGRLRMPARDLAGIRPGDVLRGDAALGAEPPHLQLLLGGRTLALARAGIDHAFQHHLEIVSMSTTNPPMPDADTAGSLGDIDIDVQFQIGAQQIRLKELAGLRPGALIALGFDPLQAFVTISANGAAVGKGELVVVEEELAVRITEWRVDAGNAVDGDAAGSDA